MNLNYCSRELGCAKSHRDSHTATPRYCTSDSPAAARRRHHRLSKLCARLVDDGESKPHLLCTVRLAWRGAKRMGVRDLIPRGVGVQPTPIWRSAMRVRRRSWRAGPCGLPLAQHACPRMACFIMAQQWHTAGLLPSSVVPTPPRYFRTGCHAASPFVLPEVPSAGRCTPTKARYARECQLEQVTNRHIG